MELSESLSRKGLEKLKILATSFSSTQLLSTSVEEGKLSHLLHIYALPWHKATFVMARMRFGLPSLSSLTASSLLGLLVSRGQQKPSLLVLS